jgi:acyl-ACP thioesterase
MYQFQSKIRYSEVGTDDKLRLDHLVGYFQDVSTLQSEELGIGVEFMTPRHEAWIMVSWQVIVDRYPKDGEEIVVSTWPYGFKGFYGFRNFMMKTVGGEVLAYANSFWVFMDTEKNRIKKVPPEILTAYEMGEKLDMEYADRKIHYEEMELSECPGVPVRKAWLDTNFHMNNVRYIELAMEYLSEQDTVRQVRCEYRNMAKLGDEIHPYVAKKDSRVVVVLQNAKGEVFVVVEFLLTTKPLQ